LPVGTMRRISETQPSFLVAKTFLPPHCQSLRLSNV
jgi:hypothetical protein